MAKAPARQPGTAELCGKLVGSTIALPAASLVFLVALSGGMPLDTLVLRTVASGAVIYLATSWTTRILTAWILKDMKRQRLLAESEDAESDVATGVSG